MKNEDISSKDTLRTFLQTHAKKRGILLRKIGEAIGIKPAYFSDIINGRKKRSVEFLNSLADYLEVPRVDVYQAAGLLDLDEDDLMSNRIKEWAVKDPNFRQAMERMVAMDEDQRSRMFSWIFYKTLQETNRLETEQPVTFTWDEAIRTGEVRSDALDELTPEQRKALFGMVQLLLEAFMAKRSQGEAEKLLRDALRESSE